MSLVALARQRLAELQGARGTPGGTRLERLEHGGCVVQVGQRSNVPPLGVGTVERPPPLAADCVPSNFSDWPAGLERLATADPPPGWPA